MRPCPQCSHPCDTEHQFCPSCGFPIGKVSMGGGEDPLIGRTLPGGFGILELIGVGGMGRVYRAEQTNLGRTVAVKIVHPHLSGEENAVARFITEARAASRLNHPNSVAVIDFGKTNDGQLYLVMEYLRGKDLARVAYEEGPLPFRRIVDVLRQTLAALAEAHHFDIIHRDLKPENIILEPVRGGGDFVKVVDFGLAKMQVEKSQPSITSPGIVCGTPEYMSPEQGRGDPLDARSDIYAVGVILYQLLTGRLPFEAETPTQVVLMHLSKPVPDPNGVAPERKIPKPLVDVLYKALAKETKDRYQSSDDLSKALGDAMASIEASARQSGTNRCSKCGSVNAPGQKFCGECGTGLAGTQSPQPPVASVRIDGRAPTIMSPKPKAPLSGEHPLPFIGREEDLSWIDEHRGRAKSASCAVRVAGEAGVGKTRLLKELAAMCVAAGDLVVSVGPDPMWAEVGYYSLRRAIVRLAELPKDGGNHTHWAAASAEARAGLAQIFSKVDSNPRSLRADKAAALTPDQRRFAAAEALRWAMLRASGQVGGRRVVLCIDDLQAVDGASRNAFADVVGEPPLAPVLIVGAHASTFDPHWERSTLRLLAPLLGPVVSRLVASASGAKGSGSGSGAALPVISSTRGVVPLYIEQLIRFMKEQGTAAPPRLADLVALRIERLEADARRLLQAIAVTGDEASDDNVLPLLPEGTDLEAAVMTLRKGGMIEQEGDQWRVTHPLLREIVLATIPAAARRELHAKAAEVAETLGAPLEVRAIHQFYAQNAFEALLLLERVSGQCAQRGDIAGSALSLRRGLELARREMFRGDLDDPERAVLIFARKLGEALAQLGDFTDAEGVLREALDMAGPNGQDRARVLGALAHVAHGRDKQREAAAYLREALELANRSGSHELVTTLQDLKRAIAV